VLYKMRALQVVSSETHTYMTLTWWLLLLLLLLLSLLYESQCWHIQSREVLHTKDVDEEVEEERKRKVICEMRGIYNSLHWQISSSELSEKITQAMKKFSSANLICMKQANMCQQTLTTVWQPFQKLKAQPWRKRKRWCHELNSY